MDYNIDYKKAIEIVKDLSDRGYPTYKKAKELAIESLEKQIPVKPIYSDYDDDGYDNIIPNEARCPVCGHEFEFGTWNEWDTPYCVCGQKMDWSE